MDHDNDLPEPLEINTEVADRLRKLQEGNLDGPEAKEDIKYLLERALELEFATIPIYLSAAYSLDADKNEAIRTLLIRTAKEEMLHMTVVANLMNAIGIRPDIRKAAPDYYAPGGFHLSLLKSNLKLELRSFDSDLLETFMKIEAPENPLKSDPEKPSEPKNPYKTIGNFYEAIIEIIKSPTSDKWFKTIEEGKQIQIRRINFEKICYRKTGKPEGFPLPYDPYGPDNPKRRINFAITSKKKALWYLNWLVKEGEGSKDTGIDDEGLPAHYYRFRSIKEGKYWIEDGGKRSYSGGSLKLDKEGITKFKPNSRAGDFEEKSELHQRMNAFNRLYHGAIGQLHKAFNSSDQEKTDAYKEAVRLMSSEMAGAADRIIATMGNQHAGIPFEPPIQSGAKALDH